MKYLIDCNNIISDGSLVRDYRISCIVNFLNDNCNFPLSPQAMKVLRANPKLAYMPAIIAETKDKRTLLLGVFESKAEAWTVLNDILKNLQSRSEMNYIVNDGIISSIPEFAQLYISYDEDYNMSINSDEIMITKEDNRVEKYFENCNKRNSKNPSNNGKNGGRFNFKGGNKNNFRQQNANEINNKKNIMTINTLSKEEVKSEDKVENDYIHAE